MSPSQNLAALLEQWRELTLSEGQALRQLDWSLVKRCQQAKTELQGELDRACQAAGPVSEELRQLASQVVALEGANRQWLIGQKQALLARQAELGGATRNLQRLRHSYAASGRSCWQSYS